MSRKGGEASVVDAKKTTELMFVVTVVSVDGESTAKAFGAISDARKWASAAALNEFEGDVAGITIHETVTDSPREAIDEVKSGRAKFVEGKSHPITAEQAYRAAQAEAVRLLAKLGFSTMRHSRRPRKDD